MRDPIFARTRWTYDSYSDYWRLVELSGFPTCYVDEMRLDSDETYIVTPINGEHRPHIDAHRDGKRARLVWWNLERPDGDGPGPGRTIHDVIDELLGRYVDAIWVSDRAYAAIDTRLQHVVLGSHAGLAEGPREAPQYDWTHMSYVCPRRVPIVKELRRRHSEGPNAWGADRDRILRTTRVMVNTHQTPAAIGEPLRFALAAAYRLPLVTEHLDDGWPLVSDDDYTEAPLHLMADRTTGVLGDEYRQHRMGGSLHHRLCVEWTFRRGVEEAMAAMVPA